MVAASATSDTTLCGALHGRTSFRCSSRLKTT